MLYFKQEYYFIKYVAVITIYSALLLYISNTYEVYLLFRFQSREEKYEKENFINSISYSNGIFIKCM